MLDDFPKSHGQERENKILDCIKSGRYDINFIPLNTEYNGHKIIFYVCEDALKIDGIRINVTAKTQQQIADLLKCILPTAKLYDLMWTNSNKKLSPHPRNITSETSAMISHSQEIDKEILAKKITGFVGPVAKTWLIDNSLVTKTDKAINYGWYIESGNSYKGIKGSLTASIPNAYIIQPRSWFHDAQHSDYSQLCSLVCKECVVDGQEKNIIDVLNNPELAGSANHDGVLKIIRQPKVQELKCIIPEKRFPVSIPPIEVTQDMLIEEEPIPVEIPAVEYIPELVIAKLPVSEPVNNISNIFAFILNLFKR